jgi:hypothetical protein
LGHWQEQGFFDKTPKAQENKENIGITVEKNASAHKGNNHQSEETACRLVENISKDTSDKSFNVHKDKGLQLLDGKN